MLGYDSINSTLQTLAVKERIRTFLLIHFLLTFPSFVHFNEKKSEIDFFVSSYLKAFKRLIGADKDESLMIKYYLASIFDKEPSYNFNNDLETIKGDGREYFELIFKETIQEFQKIFSGEDKEKEIKAGKNPVETFIRNLETYNVTYGAGSAGIMTKFLGTDDKVPWEDFYKTKKSIAHFPFVNNPDKFFFELYFVGDPKKSGEKFLTFEEAYNLKRDNSDFGITKIGIRLMMSVSKREIFSDGRLWLMFREFFGNPFTSNDDNLLFPEQDSLIKHIETGGEIYGYRHPLQPFFDNDANTKGFKAALRVKAIAPTILLSDPVNVYRLYNVPVFREESGSSIDGVTLDNHFDSLIQGAKKKALPLSELEGKYEIFSKEWESLLDKFIERKEVNDFFTENIPIGTLLSLIPIYYSLLLQEDNSFIVDYIVALGDQLSINQYADSADKLLEELTKFDEYT